jgi:hypothetical protein
MLAEPGFDAGPVLEYALEPVVTAVTEELSGVPGPAAGMRKKRKSGPS